MFEKEIQWLVKEKYGGKISAELEKDKERLQKGEPVDYVIGFSDFLGCKINLLERPLIPRPETEFWVGEAIKDILTYSSLSGCSDCDCDVVKVLDIFAGSGCIGIAVLKHVKSAKVDFADCDKNAIEQIKKNLKLNASLIRANKGYTDKKKNVVIKSDVFENIKGKYDFILANPPYIAKTKKDKVRDSVLKFEPKKALFGGEDGLLFIRKFLEGAKSHLRRPASAKASARRGKIYMEFDSWQKPKIEKILKNLGHKNFEFKKDQYNKWRYIVIYEYKNSIRR